MTPARLIRDRDEQRQRSMALILAILLHILVFAVLIFVRSRPEPVQMGSRLKGFMLMPDAKEKGKEKSQEKKAEKSKAAKAQTAKTVEAKEPPPPTPKPEVPDVPSHNKLPFIEMSSEDFANGNIANKQSSKQASAGTSGDSKASAGPGEGPGGANLYAADWYREPTSTELNGYIPASAPRNGWGDIACKTAARYHVEDCVTLGESPAGSGFGRAVRDAAWQFLVLPPRINGRNQIGAWVRIHIVYYDGVIKPGG